MKRGFLLLWHLAMRCVRIGLGGVLLPNCLVVDYKCVIDIVPAIDWIVLIVHPFAGDKLLTRFVWFPSFDRSVS